MDLATWQHRAAFNAMLAFNPRQPRDTRGRWTKAAGGVPAADPRATLARGIKSGIADRQRLGDGASATVERVTFNDGSEAVRKYTRKVLGRSAKDQNDAEELAAKVAQAIGVKAPAVLRVSDAEILMEYEPDHMPAASWLRGAETERLATTPQGQRMGLLDLLISNPDRHPGNYLVSDDQSEITAIDHGFAWEDLEDFYPSVFLRSYGRTAPLSPEDVETLRPRLQALRGDFEQLGHADWHDSVMEMFEHIAPRAVGTERLFSITAAFNPSQRRGPDGKWVKMGGAALPVYRPVKPVPRGAIFADGWMHRTDLAERAAGFWQGRFGDQRAIRDVFRNINAGREPMDGINLDKGFNMTYLRVEERPPLGIGWEQWEADHPDGGPRVYDKDDLRDELTNAALWLRESLADAPVTRQPLYRGLRMKKADIPAVGDAWDSDVISWAEDRGWAEVYAMREEDPELGRVGEMEVVLKLAGPKRSVDLGPELLDEHLTSGRYRVTRVSGKGRKRFVTVEEVQP
jgi:hypothetical protein